MTSNGRRAVEFKIGWMITGAPITTLPPELFSAIFDHVDLIDLQATSLAITRALPHSPIPMHHLFLCITLRTRRQVVALMRRLVFGKEKGREEASWVKHFAFRGWDVDPDVLNNLLNHLPNLLSLHINVGAVFAPEHLEDMIRKPRSTLKHLSLTFRPYVERATYYQFLKGAYFDGFLEILAQWPTLSDNEAGEGLRTLSIVQEPPPRHLNSLATYTSFAQPMVFFSFKPVSTLARSSNVGESIRGLRLRIPSRLYARELSVASAFPGLTFLDVSTSVIAESELKELLIAFRGLKHLVVDATGLCGYGGVRNGWRDVGRICASSGIERARAKERSVNQQIARRRQEKEAEGTTFVPPPASVNATRNQETTSRSRRPQAFGSSSISIREAPGLSHAPADKPPDKPVGKFVPKTAKPQGSGRHPPSGSTPVPTPGRTGIRILPPPPTLRTLCAATGPDEPQPTVESQAEWIEEFEEGWKEGIERLKEHWNRLTIFTRNASTIDLVMYATTDSEPERLGTRSGDADRIALAGLVDADGGRFQDALTVGWERPPVICFGSESSMPQQRYSEGTSFGTFFAHGDGCGHVVGQELW